MEWVEGVKVSEGRQAPNGFASRSAAAATASPRLSAGAWALLAAFGAIYSFLYVWQPVTTRAVGGGDFAVYHAAGRALLAGRSPYTVAGFLYPPALSFLFAPLALLPFRAAWWCWFALGHAAVAWAAWWTTRALGPGPRRWLVVGATWTAGHALAVSFVEGQVNALLLVAVCLALWPPRRAPWLGPVGAAAAFAIKVWPGVLWAEDLLLRRWRRLLLSVSLGAALIAVPLAAIACCLRGPLQPPSAAQNFFGTPAFLNASLPGLALRLSDPPTRGADLPANWVSGGLLQKLRLSRSDRVLAVVVSVAALGSGLALLAAALRRRREPPPESWRMGAALVALALVASPVSWPHYPVLQLPGTAALAHELLAAGRWRRLSALALCFLAVNWTEALVVGPYVTAYGIVVSAPAVTWAITTLPVGGGVGLFVLHLLALRTNRRAGASAASYAAAAPAGA